MPLKRRTRATADKIPLAFLRSVAATRRSGGLLLHGVRSLDAFVVGRHQQYSTAVVDEARTSTDQTAKTH